MLGAGTILYIDLKHSNCWERQLPFTDSDRLTLDEFKRELEQWRCYDKETVVEECDGIPVFVNEFWTSKQRTAHSLLAGKTSLFARWSQRLRKRTSFTWTRPIRVRPLREITGSYDEFSDALQAMNDQGLSYMASYNGKTGEKSHGKSLPRSLSLMC